MLQNRHHSTQYPPTASRPWSNAPSTTPTHRAVAYTERITDQVGQWYGRWVGGSVELSVIPVILLFSVRKTCMENSKLLHVDFPSVCIEISG